MPLIPAIPARRRVQPWSSRNDFLTHLASVLSSSSRRRSPRARVDCGLNIESLESRMTPAVVTTTDDVLDGSDGLTSLREAVIAAVAAGGNQTIQLQAGTYTLSLNGSGPDEQIGDLDVYNPGTATPLFLTIDGSTSGPTIIDANGIDRVFEIVGDVAVRFRHVSITGGSTTSFLGGGGLFISGSRVEIDNSTISGNTVNAFSGGNGGGIYFYNLSENGGLSVVNSTITENWASGGGGGVYVDSDADNVELRHVTITENYSIFAAGVQNDGLAVRLTYSIAYANHNTAGGDIDLGGGMGGSTGSIAGVLDSSVTNFPTPANGVGAAFDPLFGALDYYGGVTKTYSLGTGSRAIDFAVGSTNITDQRNLTRPIDGDSNGSAIADAGAYEVQPPTSTTVSGTVSGHIWYDLDTDGIYDSGEGGSEPDAANIKIRLYWSNGDLITSVTTDANGNYSIYLENEPRPTSTAVLYLVGVRPSSSYYWTFKDVGEDDDVDSDLSTNTGVSDPFLFKADSIIIIEVPSYNALGFTESPTPPTPVSSLTIDGGLYYSPTYDGYDRGREDPSEYPTSPVIGPDTVDPFGFFYKVPISTPTPRNNSFVSSPVGLDVDPNSLGDQQNRGEQAYLNVYKVIEVGRSRLTERIAMVTIDASDPNVAQGLLGAAAPGRYRVTVQDRLGEELVWEGDLPFNFAAAQSGVQKAWKTVRERIDTLRDQRDAAPRERAPIHAEKPDGNTSSQGAWSEQVERLATLLTGLDLPGRDAPLSVR